MCTECYLIEYDLATYVAFVDGNGKLHCHDGPALIWNIGIHEYWVHGKKHRDGDEPAVISADGRVEYWVNGKLHRDGDEPAVIWTNGWVEYWLRGAFISSKLLDLQATHVGGNITPFRVHT